MDSHYKDNTVSWPSYLPNGNPWKDGLYIETRPLSQSRELMQYMMSLRSLFQNQILLSILTQFPFTWSFCDFKRALHDCVAKMNVTDERDFARFEIKISFGGREISYIATALWLMNDYEYLCIIKDAPYSRQIQYHISCGLLDFETVQGNIIVFHVTRLFCQR